MLWRADTGFAVDVIDFQRLAARAVQAREARDERSAVEAAVAVYAGDLLPGCYDDWVVAERERLREAFFGAAERLAELIELERDYRAALPWARRLVEHDPVNEGACRRLMRLNALCGDRAEALRAYHGCATALVREVGVAPGAATRQAYERLLESEAEPSPEHARAGARAIASDGVVLVGRSREWKALRRAWERAAHGESLLVLIAGEAGIGKSRLAEVFSAAGSHVRG